MPVNKVKDDADLSSNRLSSKSLSDAKIYKRTLFYIDIDAVTVDADDREVKGYCSTSDEHQLALDYADKIEEYLRSFDLKVYFKTDTGNGASLYYRINLSNDDTEMFSNVLHHLLDKYEQESGHKVSIDTSVCNLGRWTKIPGTYSRNKKEDMSAGRIQRPSKITYIDESMPENTAVKHFKDIATLYKNTVKEIQGIKKNSLNIDIKRLFDDHKEIRVYKVKNEKYGTVYEVDCPADPERHRKDGKLVVMNNNIVFRCFHDNCEYGGRANHINDFLIHTA